MRPLPAKVEIVARTHSKLDETTKEANEKLGEGTMLAFSFDLSDVAGVSAFFDKIESSMRPKAVRFQS